MSDNIACPICWVLFLKYKLARDVTYGGQQHTVVTEASQSNRFNRPWLPDRRLLYWCSPISSRHVVCHRRSALCEDRFAPMSLFFVAADAYRRSFCELFSAANMNNFLLLNRTKITSFSNCSSYNYDISSHHLFGENQPMFINWIGNPTGP